MTETRVLERGFTLTRMLDAPRELVFRAWTEPAHLGWFLNDDMPQKGPIEVDLRVGGVWRLMMVENEDREYFTGGVYREIVAVERLVFTWGAVDGWPKLDLDRLDDSPLVTVTLNEVGRRTEMSFTVALPDHLSDDAVREWFALGVREGWGDTIDRIETSFPAAVATN